jgi:hypothetical protein
VAPVVIAVKSSVTVPAAPPMKPPLAAGWSGLSSRLGSMPSTVWLPSTDMSIDQCSSSTSDWARPNEAKLRGPYSEMFWRLPATAMRAPAQGRRSKPSRAVRASTVSPSAIS